MVRARARAHADTNEVIKALYYTEKCLNHYAVIITSLFVWYALSYLCATYAYSTFKHASSRVILLFLICKLFNYFFVYRNELRFPTFLLIKNNWRWIYINDFSKMSSQKRDRKYNYNITTKLKSLVSLFW